MLEEIEALIREIRDPSLKKKVSNLIRKPSVKVSGRRVEFCIEESPGSLSRHHSYNGGLPQHMIAVTRLALFLSDLVESVYGAEVDRDVVISASLLHDLMKPIMYSTSEDGSYVLSRLGERVDHISLVTSELMRRNFPLDVVHAVVAHHGEFGPMRPKTLEALIVHIADIADSKINGEVLKAAKYLIREVEGVDVERLSPEDAFGVIKASTEEGVEGVRRYIKEKLSSYFNP